MSNTYRTILRCSFYLAVSLMQTNQYSLQQNWAVSMKLDVSPLTAASVLNPYLVATKRIFRSESKKINANPDGLFCIFA
jgi:hypothetical protein